MALLFDDAASEYLQSSLPEITGEPFSMHAWVRPDSITSLGCVVSLSDSSSVWMQHALYVESSRIKASSRADGGFVVATTSTNIIVNEWSSVLGVWASTASRTAYLNGGNSAENTVERAVTGIDSIDVARLGDASPGAYWSGRIAEIAIWDTALDAVDAVVLAAGFSALFVKPQNLVSYRRLLGRTTLANDIVGGVNLTLFNTPVWGEHPRIIYPYRQRVVAPGAAAPPSGLSIPIVYHHRQRNFAA